MHECDAVRGDRIPYIWHDPGEPDWHGWDEHFGDPNKELKIIRSPALDERYYRVSSFPENTYFQEP